MNGSVKSEVSGKKIKVELTHTLDKDMYNYPLTLRTTVPGSWKKAMVKQNSRVQEVTVDNGKILYELEPNKGIAEISSL